MVQCNLLSFLSVIPFPYHTYHSTPSRPTSYHHHHLHHNVHLHPTPSHYTIHHHNILESEKTFPSTAQISILPLPPFFSYLLTSSLPPFLPPFLPSLLTHLHIHSARSNKITDTYTKRGSLSTHVLPLGKGTGMGESRVESEIACLVA